MGMFIHPHGVKFAVFDFCTWIVQGFNFLLTGYASPLRGTICLPGSNLFWSDNVNPCQRPFPSRSARSFIGIIISPLIDKIDARFLPSLAPPVVHIFHLHLEPKHGCSLPCPILFKYKYRVFENHPAWGPFRDASPVIAKKWFPRGTATGAKTG